MKTVTETRYQTADGRTFNDEMKARTHEIETIGKSMMPKGDDGEPVKLTQSQLIGAMANNPQPFIDLLLSFTAEEETAEAAE